MISINKKAKVYVIIPAYNRVKLTRRCIELLLGQTYNDISIVVSDGNSPDKTAEIIDKEFTSVEVLHSRKILWWGGAMKKGIDYVLERSTSENDFILMMNDDTEFQVDFVEKMVNASNTYSATVGALISDINDQDKILDAGVKIDWNKYLFIGKDTIDGETINFDVDTLPGRGTIIPVAVVRSVGNINANKLPHYMSDYEYFHRIKKNGFKLAVTYETKILVHTDKTGVTDITTNNIFMKIFHRFSRRSKRNIIDQYNFIDLVAPDELRKDLKRRFLPKMLRKVLYFMDGSTLRE